MREIIYDVRTNVSSVRTEKIEIDNDDNDDDDDESPEA